MTNPGENADDLDFIVDLLVRMHFDERVRSMGNRAGRLPTGTDIALSAVDLEQVAGSPAAPPLAGDGGDSRVTARLIEDTLLVVADLEGVDRDDRLTEIDLGEDSVVLSIDGRIAWQIPVERRPTSITDVSINNDVLSFRVAVE